MRCGISTSCFFPLDTVESLKRVADTGAKVTEIFFNTFSELEDRYVAKLLDEKNTAGMDISSVHPCSSAMEGFFFASHYKTRFHDGVVLYRRMFEVCRILGADKLVFHGDHDFNIKLFSMQEYAENYIALARIGQEYGVTLCHENVAYCRLGEYEHVNTLRPLLGEYAAFVLDTKQVRRKVHSIRHMLNAMGRDIRQVHISDSTVKENCLPPGEGGFDFPRFIASLRENDYDNDLIIELYSDNYKGIKQLAQAMQYVQSLL